MPKTYVTEIIGYAFKELKEEAQYSIFESDLYFSNEVDFSPIEDDFRSLLMESFGADRDSLEVYYDVSYSQGSGACCVGTLDVQTVFENRAGAIFPKLLGLINSGNVTIDAIKVVRCGPSNFYNHENTCRVDVHYSCDSNKVGDWEGEDVTDLEEMLTNAIREELRDLHNKLQDHYEESTSFEAYCEAMNDSDTVFTEEGSVIDPTLIEHARVYDTYQLKLDFDECE